MSSAKSAGDCSSNPPVALECWPDRLEAVLQNCGLLRRVLVLRETDSTQDAARRMNCAAGDIVVAWRQTAGRGRLGRAWADTAEQGVALTMVLDRETTPGRLAIAAAVGAAIAVEKLANRPVQIKWPNDIIADRRKLAGILIEQVNSVALIGIGLNVAQSNWPPELADRAVSLAQLDVQVDRLDVLCALLPALDDSLRMDDQTLGEQIARRDLLRGRNVTVRSGERIITGAVKRIDPLRGLSVETDEGDVWLEAATATVLDYEGRL